MLALRRHLLVRRPIGLRALSTKPASNVLDELDERGFVSATTSPELRSHLNSKTTVYAGVDPSASSLHVGNLLPLLGLLHFRARGHQALALIGGATGAIGDPSGRSTERNALDKATLAENVAGITSQVNRFFDRGIAYAKKRGCDTETASPTADGATSTGYAVLNNHDWFRDMSFLDFLRDVGKYARVSTMLARESVKSRLDSDAGISFTEFSYQLLQAHDFNVLYRDQGCRVQLGGSDQWGNIVAGIDMIKRTKAAELAQAAAEVEAKLEQQQGGKKAKAAKAKSAEDEVKKEEEPAFGLTIPLLTTSTGEKFGKSAGNAVWLDEKRTSISDFYQFFYRAPDADVEKYLNVLTLLPPSEIRSVLKQHRANPKARLAQKTLAREVTELVHGESGVEQAELLAGLLFMRDLRALKSQQVLDIIQSGQSDPRLVYVKRSEIKGVPVSKLAVTYGLVKARAEASRIISSKGMTLNGDTINDPRRLVRVQELIDGHLAVLKKGNKACVVLYVELD